jgi:hypothetical protein
MYGFRAISAFFRLFRRFLQPSVKESEFMKKILRFYLPAFITIFSLMVFAFVYLWKNHPILLGFALGKARVISTRVEATVKIDGVEQPESRVFSLDGGEKLLVYSPRVKGTYPVIIVDKPANDIGETNAGGKEDYELFFDRFLFQSESAYGVVYASSAKWGHKPKLEIADERISYVIPKKNENGNYINVNVEIIFKGEK